MGGIRILSPHFPKCLPLSSLVLSTYILVSHTKTKITRIRDPYYILPQLSTNFSTPLLNYYNKTSPKSLHFLTFFSLSKVLQSVYPASPLKQLSQLNSSSKEGRKSLTSSFSSYSTSHHHWTWPTYLHETFPLSFPPISLALFLSLLCLYPNIKSALLTTGHLKCGRPVGWAVKVNSTLDFEAVV